MISFDAAHRAVHYPDDRRFRVWIRPSILIGIALAIFCALGFSLPWPVCLIYRPLPRSIQTIFQDHTDFRSGCATAIFLISFS